MIFYYYSEGGLKMPKGVYERKKSSKIYKRKILSDEQDLLISKLYSEGKRQTEIARMFSVRPSIIKLSLRKTNTPIDPKRGGNPQDKNYFWKGGRYIDFGGYVLIHQPNHPNANSQGYVREHRLLVSNVLGRPLKRNEVVHHKNGIHSDNRLENLVLFSSNGVHLGVELMGKAPKWTKEGIQKILSRKAPSMKGIPRAPIGNGVRLLRRRKIHQYLHEKSRTDNNGLEIVQSQLPSFSRKVSKKKREKV
jgi:hypothetical protein